MKTYKLNKFVRTLAMLLVGVFTITNVCTVPIFAQTESVVTYAAKDDFESYSEWPEKYAFTGDGVKKLAQKDNNQYLKLEASENTTPTLSYAFTQAYKKNYTTPLWIELSLCGAPEGEAFSEWYLRGRVSSGSTKEPILSGAGNVVSCGETKLTTLSSDSFTKFIIKVVGNGTNFSYSVWVGEYSGEPAATGSLTSIADFGKINLNSNKKADKVQYLGFDNFAVYASNEYQNVFKQESEPDELTYVAQIGDDKYETLQEAITAAHDALTNPTTGAVEIVLCAHVTSSEDIIINSGVTLDLNGKTLTASSLATFGGNVVDSSENKDGVLEVDSTKCTFATTNKQMPVYNGTDGYVFADITKQEKHSIAEEGDSAIFNLIFRPFFGLETSIQNALLVDGNGIDDQFSVIIRLTWKDGTQDLIFKDEMVQAVYGSDKAFYINASGVTSFEGLTITPMVVSDTLGVTWSGSSFTDFSATGYTVTE